MPSFLDDVSAFYGTGEKNAAGQTLEEFLAAYDPYKYRTPSCTTDAAVFSYRGGLENAFGSLKLLLVRRSNHPSIGCWALPGGFVELRENLEDTARRELEEETGVRDLPVEQFACYGDYDRDPRTRVITTAYMALINEESVSVKAGDDAADAAWFRLSVQRNGEAVCAGDWETEEYVLNLENEERHLHTSALVERRTRRGMIREQKFTVKDRGMTAVDHAAIIVQAYLILAERMSGSPASEVRR